MACNRVIRRLRNAAALAAIALACAGPTTARAQQFQELLEGVQRVLAPPTAEPIPAPQHQGVHLPLATIAEDAPIDVDAKDGLISLSVRDASLRQVLAALAETQGLNLVVASPADIPVTAKFDRMPVRHVLDSLLSSNGHSWSEHRGVIYVTSLATGAGLMPEVQGRRVAVIELDFASASDLQTPIAGLLSAVGQSHFIETDPIDNRRTKELLVVEDLEPFVARIEAYVAQADQPPRQVLIEVHILQVNLDEDQRSGVNLNALARISDASLTVSTTGMANAAASPGFFIESTGGDLDSLIEALIATTDAKSLAAPRLLALNGQTSRMQIGERLGYRVTTTTETSSLESVDFLDVGVVLTVTPRITRDGRVLMRIRPEVSTGAVNPDTGVPDSETTELETDVLLNSSQGMVIGGLIQERDDTTISRVPVLGTLPYVNFLFQRRQVVKRRTELIVALVPHVLPYEPIQAVRNDEGFARAFDPLTHGPLCRYPRPYEPRLYDPLTDERRIECLHEPEDPRCVDCGVNGGERSCGEVVATPTLAAQRLRRLPPVAAEPATRTAIRPTATWPVR